MKKVIGVILMAGIILISGLSIPSKTSAITGGVINDDALFDSSTKTTQWLTKNTGSHGSKDFKYNSQDNSMATTNSCYTDEILSGNGLDKTDIKDFEWQFDYSSNAWARSAFLYHVDSKDETYKSEYNNIGGQSYTALMSLKNLFAVEILGNNGGNPLIGSYPNSLTILYPTSTGLLPVGSHKVTKEEIVSKYSGYTGGDLSNMPDDNGYISLVGLTGKNDIDITKYFSINIKLSNKKITVSVWQESGNNTKENTFRTLSYVFDKDSFTYAKSGDFVITNGDCPSNIKNMTIKSIDEKENGLIFDTESEFDARKDSTWIANGNTEYNNNSTLPKWDNDKQATFLNNYFSSTKLLDNNSYKNTNLNNFVWQFDFMPKDSKWTNISFLFHVGENSALPTGSDTSKADIVNCMGVSFFGTNHADSTSSIEKNSLVVNAPSSNGDFICANTYTKSVNGVNVVKPGSYQNTANPVQNKFYTIRIIYKDNSLTAAIWETDNKEATYRTVYYEYSSDQVEKAPNGDFAIYQGNTAGYIKNMKIYNGTDDFESSEDYSNYNQLVSPTKYTFDNDGMGMDGFNIVDKGIKTEWDSEKKAIKFTTDENNYAYTDIIDSGNKMSDFILKYDFIQNHNWSRELVNFRVQDGQHYYSIRINKSGKDCTEANQSDKIMITKTDGLDSENNLIVDTLQEISLCKSVTNDKEYTIRLQAIGNEFKVWFDPKGNLLSEPNMIVKDDRDIFTSGTSRIGHLKSIAYIDNIEFYDITAFNMAEKVNSLNPLESIAVSDRHYLRNLNTELYNMNSIQLNKLSTYNQILKEDIDKVEKISMSVRGMNDVNIIDLVRLKKHLLDSNIEISQYCNPHLDNEDDSVIIDYNDIKDLKKYLLGLEYFN